MGFLIIVAVVLCLMLGVDFVRDTYLLLIAAAVLILILTIFMNEYYKNHNYYRWRHFCPEFFSRLFFVASVILFACNFVIGSANYFSNALISALIAYVVVVYLFIAYFRGAAASDEASKETMESIIRFTEEHSYADYAIFYTNTTDFAEHTIVADVVFDSDNKPVTFPVCIADDHGLERFANYAKTHYRDVSDFKYSSESSSKSVLIWFQ